MNGGLAARQPVATESAAPARPAPVPAAPVMEPATADVATTRDRMQASFGVDATEEPLTMRGRIVNRARAEELEPAIVPRADQVEVPVAEVVDIGEARDRLRPPAPEAPGREGEPAQVIELATRAEPTARAPPAAPAPAEAPTPGDTVAEDGLARAPPEPEPEAAAPAEPAAAEEALLVAEAPRPVGGPEDDPAFQAMKERAEAAATLTKDHQPADQGAAVAQAASEPDVARDKLSKGAEERVGVMAGKKPGEFDPAKFTEDVKAAVVRMAPPATLEEADEFRKSRKAGGAANAIKGIVKKGKESSEHDIKDANAVPPSPEGKTPKAVVKPMVNDRVGPPAPDVEAESALPGLRPDSDVDLSPSPLAIKIQLAKAKVTEQQLAEGNEPVFDTALDAIDAVRKHSATGPAAYREQEAGVLGAAKGEAGPAAAAQLEGMRDSRGNTLGAVLGKKDLTKDADKKLHDDVHGKILDIHARTQSDVEKILGLLDKAVESLFTSGEEAARKTFEDEVARDMRAYKRRRYGGWFGWTKWLKDRFCDLPSEVNRYYEAARTNYLTTMGSVIEGIALVVGVMLGLAHQRIVTGREEVTTLVEKGLPDSLRHLGRTAAADLDYKFDDLAGDVDAKRDELVDTVARLYIDSRTKLDERIEELKEENKGLASRAYDATVRVLKTIWELGKLLVRVLLKAASAIGDILGSPIRFLRNLVGAVKGGLDRFVSRIWEHLQNAMLDLLLGQLRNVGITMPRQLDFAGILDLVLQVLGLTYADIRARLVDRFGPEAVAHMEETVDVFKTILGEGLGGLWTWIKDKLGDLEDLVIGKIKAYIVERVIKAGIGYIVALLNPAAAFIKACQGIYQIVMFVVERARQIAEFVDSVLDSISAIARGDTGKAVERIDNALGNALSFAIAFLARLANLGSLSERVQSIIAAVRRPITRVLDLVIFGAAGLYRRTIGRAVAFGREKVEAGREWVKGKADAAQAWAKNKVEAGKLRVTSRDLPREPPAETEKPQPAAPDPAYPIRLAEDRIEVGSERHTVFAQLSADGQVDIGMSSETRPIGAMLDRYEPRIGTLPEEPPEPLPAGGDPRDRPRSHARRGAEMLRQDPEAIEADFERTVTPPVQVRRGGVIQGAAPPPPRPRPTATPSQARQIVTLADMIEGFLRIFRVYDRPEFEPVAEEPAGGQRLEARIWAERDVEGYILQAGGRLGIDPDQPAGADHAFIAEPPGLVGTKRSRGIVGQEAQDPAQPNVLVRTWAVGGTMSKATNTSHTENLFAFWFGKQTDLWERVTAIELHSVNSPCSACTGTLKDVAAHVRPRTPLIILWDQVYWGSGKNRAARTTLSDLGVLRASGWFYEGPRPTR